VDRQRYLDESREICLKEQCALHAYVLMTNHVHLLATPSRAGQIARVTQALGQRYVRYINDRYHRTGSSSKVATRRVWSTAKPTCFAATAISR
jgi:putative transposase